MMNIVVSSINEMIEFQITKEVIVSSSIYYYCIDNGFNLGDDSFDKGFENVKTNVNSWIDFVRTSNVGEELFAPFEFEDEYVGVLVFKIRDKDKLDISYFVTREIAGYSILPSSSIDSKVKYDFENYSYDFQVVVSKDCFLKVQVKKGGNVVV